MKIHPKFVALIYILLFLFIAIFFKVIFEINIFKNKYFFIFYIIGGCITAVIAWIKYER